MTTPTTYSVEMIPLHKLEMWDEVNVRKYNVDENLDELASNIKQNGIQMPLLVAKNDSKYRVFSGQRRLKACIKAEILEVPCRVFTDITKEKARILSLSENLYRLEMEPGDMSDACNLLLHHFDGNKQRVADALGVSLPTIYNYLGYTALPSEIKAMVGDRKLTRSQALAIFRKFDSDKAKSVCEALAQIPNTNRRARQLLYNTIQNASKNDSLDQIQNTAEKSEDMVKYVLFLPKSKSDTLEKLAGNTLIDKEELALDFLLQQIKQYERRL